MTDNNSTTPSLIGLRDEGMFLLRSLSRLEALYLLLRQSGLSKAIPEPDEVAGSAALKQLLGQLRQVDSDLDWELTSEIVRLRDLCQERAADYAKGQYGVTVGGHIRLPPGLPGVPDKVRVSAVGFVDEAPHELRLEGNPVRSDGTLLSAVIPMLLGPEGIKVNVAGAAKRSGLRDRMIR